MLLRSNVGKTLRVNWVATRYKEHTSKSRIFDRQMLFLCQMFPKANSANKRCLWSIIYWIKMKTRIRHLQNAGKTQITHKFSELAVTPLKRARFFIFQPLN